MKEIYYATISLVITRYLIYIVDFQQNLRLEMEEYDTISKVNHLVVILITVIYFVYIIQIIYRIRKHKD